jgi:hypothetical protein
MLRPRRKNTRDRVAHQPMLRDREGLPIKAALAPTAAATVATCRKMKSIARKACGAVEGK